MRYTFVQQHDMTDCAATCLAMVCLHYKKETKTDDKVGYGLIQWTDKSRKEGLEKTAKEELKLNVSNINAQLAWFRKEVTGTEAYSKSWDKIKKAKTVKETSEIYLREIENPRQLNYDERTKHSRIIYNSIKNISGV